MSETPKAHAGWFCIYEEDLRLIEATFDREAARRKAGAALLAVTRIANLERKATFTRAISSIARDMAYSYPHAAEALQLLKTAGIITIEERKVSGSKENAPSRYTVTRLEQNVPRLEPTKKSSGSPRVSNKLKEPQRRTKNIQHPFSEKKGVVPSYTELLDMGYYPAQAEVLELFNQRLVPLGYLPVDKCTEEVEKILEVHQDGIEDLIISIANEGQPPEPGNNTFVRMGWGNY